MRMNNRRETQNSRGHTGIWVYELMRLFCVLGLASLPHLCYAAQVTESAPAQMGSSETVQYVRRIVFHGNRALNDSKLAELLAIEPGQRFDPQSVDDTLPRILDEYRRLGYIFAEVRWERTPVEENQVALNIEVHEGQMIRMGDIELSGNTVLSTERLLNELDIRRNAVFDDSVFQRDMERLLELYSGKGYPMASISPSELWIQDGRLNVKIDIDEGPLVKIDQVQIHGLKKTSERTVLRELTVHPGDIFDQREIDESQRRLNNLGYFQSVGTVFKPSPTGEYDVILDFSVTEGRTGQFSGVLGYNPSEDQIGGQKFTGVLELAETNLLGTGRQIAIRGRFGLTDTYEFAYEEPWIFNSPVDVGVQLWGTNQTDTLTNQSLKERAASLSGTTRVIGFMEGSLTLTYKRIDSSSYSHSATRDSSFSSGSSGISSRSSDDPLAGRKYSLTFTLQRDSRDYFINPSSGRLDRASVEVSRGDFKTFRAWLDLNQYFETWKRQVLAIGLHGARIWGKRIPLTEIFYLGGANTLRGYSEDFFRGEGRLFANCEYRFLVSRDSQFFLFLDGGSVYDRDDGLSTLKVGYGVGMRLRSRAGLVSVDYGLARGESILSGKIHVSLGATF